MLQKPVASGRPRTGRCSPWWCLTAASGVGASAMTAGVSVAADLTRVETRRWDCRSRPLPPQHLVPGDGPAVRLESGHGSGFFQDLGQPLRITPHGLCDGRNRDPKAPARWVRPTAKGERGQLLRGESKPGGTVGLAQAMPLAEAPQRPGDGPGVGLSPLGGTAGQVGIEHEAGGHGAGHRPGAVAAGLARGYRTGAGPGRPVRRTPGPKTMAGHGSRRTSSQVATPPHGARLARVPSTSAMLTKPGCTSVLLVRTTEGPQGSSVVRACAAECLNRALHRVQRESARSAQHLAWHLTNSLLRG